MPRPVGDSLMRSVLSRFKAGNLHDTIPDGEIVTDRQQALAIALRQLDDQTGGEYYQKKQAAKPSKYRGEYIKRF